MNEIATTKLRVLLIGGEKVGKSYFFNKIHSTLTKPRTTSSISDSDFENGVKVLEKEFIFAKQIVPIQLVDVNLKGLTEEEYNDHLVKELEECDVILILYSVLRRDTFEFIEHSLMEQVIESLKDANQKSLCLPFGLYGTENDKIDHIYEIDKATNGHEFVEVNLDNKPKSVFVTQEEAKELLLENNGLFSVHASSLDAKICVKILRKLIIDSFRSKGVELEVEDTTPKLGFFSALKKMTKIRKKPNS